MLNNAQQTNHCDSDIGLPTGDFSIAGTGWHADSVAELTRILTETDACIVISSTWRKLFTVEQLRTAFESWGISGERVVGATPKTDRAFRGQEVKLWLAEFARCGNQIKTWVAIDDDSDFYDDQYLIQTSFETGLTKKQADAAIAALNN